MQECTAVLTLYHEVDVGHSDHGVRGTSNLEIDGHTHALCGIAGANVGIIKSAGDVALVDAGWTPESVDLIIFYVTHLMKSERIGYVILTHGDFDHIGGAARIQAEFGAKIVIHKDEVEKIRNPPPPVDPVSPNIVFDSRIDVAVGDRQLQLLPTPGHSRGSTCVYDEENGILFTGDTFISDNFDFVSVKRFVSLPSITDLNSYMESMREILDLKFVLTVPGHGMPVKDGRERMIAQLNRIRCISNSVYEMLDKEMSVRELATELGAFPGFVEMLVKQLVSEGKIRKTRERAIASEFSYQKV